MIRAEYNDKNLVVNILAESFDVNQSVNYVIRQDNKKFERIKKLMEYSFDMCYFYGDVFLSDDKKGCALILLPDKKKTNLKSHCCPEFATQDFLVVYKSVVIVKY